MKRRFLKGLFFIFLCIFISGQAVALTLPEGLKLLEERSRELKVAQWEEAMAGNDINIARSYQLPQLRAYINQTWLSHQPQAKFGPFGSVPVSEKDYLTYGFRVDQLVYDFGRTGSLVEASKHNLKMKTLEKKRLLNSLSLQFITAYFDALEAEHLLEVSEKEVASLEAHKRDAEALFEAGVVVRNDLLQAEVMLSDAKQRHIELKNLKKIRLSVLNRMLSHDLNSEPELKEPGNLPVSLPESLEEAWQKATALRKELRELDESLNALRERYQSVKAEFLPRLYLSGGYEYQENRYMLHEGNWMLIAGAQMELFSGGRTRAELAKLKEEMERVKTEKQRLTELIRLEVKSAFLELLSARQRVEVTKKAIEQAEENLRLQKLRYQESVGTATDVTDGIVLLTRAKTNYWSALYSLRKSEAKLLYAMGIELNRVYRKGGQ
ncbi:MAG: TolC family protein [Nitrospirae bacterium]|nr:MAG: TolC family protein [Nitrospirota bacterium]